MAIGKGGKNKTFSHRHTVRTRDGGFKELEINKRVAISLMCTECMGYGDPGECTSNYCPLYPFRKWTQRAYNG